MEDLSLKGWIVYFIIGGFMGVLSVLLYRVNERFITTPLQILGSIALMVIVNRFARWITEDKN